MNSDRTKRTDEQKQAVINILLPRLTLKDRMNVATIRAVPKEARLNYAINIWAGVLDRHSLRIARMTEGEVEIKTAADREDVASFIHKHVGHNCMIRVSPLRTIEAMTGDHEL